jgi:hypothetical protein
MTRVEVINAIKKMKAAEQIELLESLLSLLKSTIIEKHSLRELKGLGKSMWRKVDVEEYLRKERDNWTG